MAQFKFELGSIVRHRSGGGYGEKFFVLGRYALEEIGRTDTQNIYRVRSDHSHVVDMMEEEVIEQQDLPKIVWDKVTEALTPEPTTAQ